ncbi:hypothetical protein KEM54_005999 [Ascosphaera aggregata]|nr:hypothetical protein KEM54_005999 [Ascosphaera aggregata]
MEDLRQRDQLKYLWVSSVNAIFTAMIQVRVELCFSDTLLATNALVKFNSAATSLKGLGEYWIIAETLARVLLSSKRLQRDLQAVQHDLRSGPFEDPERSSGLVCGASLTDTGESSNSSSDLDGREVVASMHMPAIDQDAWLSRKLPLRPHYTNDVDEVTLEGQKKIAGEGPQQAQATGLHNTATPCTASQLSSLPMPPSRPAVTDGAQSQTLMFEQSPTTPHMPHIPTHHDYLNPSCSPTDWHQLFSFLDGSGGTNTTNGSSYACPADLLQMGHSSQFENEWRDLYLHESGMPEITDYFGQETGWMLG